MIKHFTYISEKQLWRILISGTDKLILETRNTSTKENYFQCYDLLTGEKIFSDLQLEEKHWLGIEEIYKDIIYFHKFPKPDMPWHREIIAYDIASQKVLWYNKEFSYMFAYNNLVYCFQQGFEDSTCFALDFLNGEILEELGSDYNRLTMLRQKSESEKNWNGYIYPKPLTNNVNVQISELVGKLTHNIETVGEIEYNTINNLLLCNYHVRKTDNCFTNKFFAVELNTGKVVLSEILNADSPSLFTDSFFVYKNFLFLLREKNEVIIYGLD
jgi:hypothetical protein